MASSLPPDQDERRPSGSIQRQLLWTTVSVQCLLVLGFIVLMVGHEAQDARDREDQRLNYQSDFLAASAARPLAQNDMDALVHLLEIQRRSVSVRDAQITDLQGHAIVNSNPSLNGRVTLQEDEIQALAQGLQTHVVRTANGKEGVAPVMWQGKTIALAWIYPDPRRERALIRSLLLGGIFYGILAMAANALISISLGRSMLRPINFLLRGTRKVAHGAPPADVFPLEVRTTNEIGELTEAFNAMVESLESQRAGLHDTLALLDSMLANAPVGFAFLDSKCRFVRVNQFLADMNGAPISRHLGREIEEVLLPEVAEQARQMVTTVFDTGASLSDEELSSLEADRGQSRSWSANFFPVRSSGDQVRWVGVIVSETTERKLTEEALRRSEKLAAAGRLAASIAHEINNPLEGVTNLLYLLRHHDSLDEQAREYASMAQHEVSRVSQITQQTLRFYRQSTLPVIVNVPEVVESVLVLYQGKVHAGQVRVEKRFVEPAEVFALSGEMRQLVANLIGNALDAMSGSGRLVVAVNPSQDWKTGQRGIRLVVADTGSGMDESVRRRIFEPFFTTKEATGTGLGLWVSAEILAKHQATVRVRSRTVAPSGTVFMVFFPDGGLLAELAKEKDPAAVATV